MTAVDHPTTKAPVSDKKWHPLFDLLRTARLVEMAKNERTKFIPN